MRPGAPDLILETVMLGYPGVRATWRIDPVDDGYEVRAYPAPPLLKEGSPVMRRHVFASELRACGPGGGPLVRLVSRVIRDAVEPIAAWVRVEKPARLKRLDPVYAMECPP